MAEAVVSIREDPQEWSPETVLNWRVQYDRFRNEQLTCESALQLIKRTAPRWFIEKTPDRHLPSDGVVVRVLEDLDGGVLLSGAVLRDREAIAMARWILVTLGKGGADASN